jgi:hypothetical protein
MLGFRPIFFSSITHCAKRIRFRLVRLPRVRLCSFARWPRPRRRCISTSSYHFGPQMCESTIIARVFADPRRVPRRRSLLNQRAHQALNHGRSRRMATPFLSLPANVAFYLAHELYLNISLLMSIFSIFIWSVISTSVVFIFITLGVTL